MIQKILRFFFNIFGLMKKFKRRLFRIIIIIFVGEFHESSGESKKYSKICEPDGKTTKQMPIINGEIPETLLPSEPTNGRKYTNEEAGFKRNK